MDSNSQTPPPPLLMSQKLLSMSLCFLSKLEADLHDLEHLPCPPWTSASSFPLGQPLLETGVSYGYVGLRLGTKGWEEWRQLDPSIGVSPPQDDPQGAEGTSDDYHGGLH